MSENRRIIIENRSSLPDWQAVERASKVMAEGRISNWGRQYCYLATFVDCDVVSRLNKASDSFVVLDHEEPKR